jgi:hypothetical protein
MMQIHQSSWLPACPQNLPNCQAFAWKKFGKRPDKQYNEIRAVLS